MKKIIISLLAAIAMTAVAGCYGNDDEKPVITVTIEPMRYFAEAIAGDAYEIVALVPGGSSPETYEPTMRQMAATAKSQLYIKTGSLGFERHWLKKLQESTPHLIIADASEGIVPLTNNNEKDPHIWTSPSNARRIAINIYNAMKRIDAADSLYFKENLEKLLVKIKQTSDTIAHKLEGIHSDSFIIFHPALSYFAMEYGLTQLAIEEGGHEPSAAGLHSLIDEAKERKAPIIFVQKEFASKNIGTVAEETGARRVEINPLSYDWHEEMIKIAEALCRQ